MTSFILNIIRLNSPSNVFDFSSSLIDPNPVLISLIYPNPNPVIPYLSPRKIKLPKESMKRPGVILPPRPKKQKLDSYKMEEMECHSIDTMSYNDFKTSSKAILRGIFIKKRLQRSSRKRRFLCTHSQLTLTHTHSLSLSFSLAHTRILSLCLLVCTSHYHFR